MGMGRCQWRLVASQNWRGAQRESANLSFSAAGRAWRCAGWACCAMSQALIDIEYPQVCRVSPSFAAEVPIAVPTVSVIIRSYQRPLALLELVARLLIQTYPNFEVVVFEQSGDRELWERLAAFGDPRLRFVTAKPTNPPAARNAAIRHSNGEILLLIDDDDLPIGSRWIEQHVANYRDPNCMGVVGRLVSDPERMSPPRFSKLKRLLAMRHTVFKDTRGYTNNTLEKVGIDFLIGSNASVRRSLVRRLGGWDEGIPMGEEQSFAFKFARQKSPDEYFKFDPGPVMWRRTNVAGGLGRRENEGWHLRELDSRFFYYKHVVGYYFPRRFALLRPLFVIRAILQVFEWIWDPDNCQHSVSERLTASVEIFVKFYTVLSSKHYDSSQIRRLHG